MDYATVRQNLASALCMGCMAQDTGAAICPNCGWKRGTPAQSVLHLPPGTVLRDSYLVGRVLGQGGFGITYLGWDIPLQRRVAIKEYFPQSIASRQPGSFTAAPITGRQQADFDYGLRCFMSEGRTLARFADHPCIVSVLTLFEENRTGYMVMGYLEGATLAESLEASGGKLPYDTVREIMMRVMDGLREVHSQGLLHRDVSPDNIYLTRQGPVKVLDFGAARMAIGERSQDLSVILREGYAPEEQHRRSGHQGPWTDVYAVGATLYRSITGVTPPPSPDRRYADTIKTPRELGIFIPPEAEAALMRALAVSAAERFQSIEEFESALKPRIPDTPPPKPDTPRFALFDAGSVWLATFLGSPLAGGALMAINDRRMGKDFSRPALNAAGIAALTFLVAFTMPGWAATGVTIGSIFAMKAMAESMQGAAVNEHVRLGGRKDSRWTAAGIGLVFLLAIAAVTVAAPLGWESWKNGRKVVLGSKDEVYYRGSATRNDAIALGTSLQTAGYFSDRGFKVILDKDSNGTAVSFTFTQPIWNQPAAVEVMEDLGRKIAPAVGGFPIHVRLLDTSRAIRNDVVVGKVQVAPPAGGKADTVYYYGAATELQAEALGDALQKRAYFKGSGLSVVLSKNDTVMALTLAVSDNALAPRYVPWFKTLVRDVAVSVGGLPIELRLANTRFEVKTREEVLDLTGSRKGLPGTPDSDAQLAAAAPAGRKPSGMGPESGGIAIFAAQHV